MSPWAPWLRLWFDFKKQPRVAVYLTISLVYFDREPYYHICAGAYWTGKHI